MKILGIETSCDETGIAIVEDGVKILANQLATSADIHIATGGIIPENAAREQVKVIIPILKTALAESGCDLVDIDAIAVTHGPGLVGSLLVGVETARALSFATSRPLIPTNHLYGHIYAAYLEPPTGGSKPPQFPYLALVVSGGHTDLVLLRDHGQLEYIGGTRDDAAGEAFDKCARLLGLPYPGGPAISKKALASQDRISSLPRPMLDSGDFDMSFSGLKTAVLYEVKGKKLTDQQIADTAWEIEEAIVEILVTKTIKAAQNLGVKEIVLGGGVAANTKLRTKMAESFSGRVVLPKPEFSTDNGAMIAAAAFFNNHPVNWKKITTNPNLGY